MCTTASQSNKATSLQHLFLHNLTITANNHRETSKGDRVRALSVGAKKTAELDGTRKTLRVVVQALAVLLEVVARRVPLSNLKDNKSVDSVDNNSERHSYGLGSSTKPAWAYSFHRFKTPVHFSIRVKFLQYRPKFTRLFGSSVLKKVD